MSEHHEAIAAQLNDICPAGYSKAWIDAEVSSSTSSNQYWCEVAGGRQQPEVSPLTNVRVAKQLIGFREQMGGDTAAGWSRCTFTLFPDGQFKFDIHYDD